MVHQNLGAVCHPIALDSELHVIWPMQKQFSLGSSDDFVHGGGVIALQQNELVNPVTLFQVIPQAVLGRQVIYDNPLDTGVLNAPMCGFQRSP